MKKILSLLLAAVLVFSLFPVGAQAAKGDKLVALTFDDGPSSVLTPQLLDGLKQRGVQVTFFMLGQSASANLSIVQRAYDEGHEIANHSWNHPDLYSIGLSAVKSQIEDTNAVFDQVCGKGTEYIVRPPYGSSNDAVRATIGAPIIIWSVDTLDWKYLNSSHVYSHIIQEAYDGSIVLCHDIHSTTIPGALQAIDVLLANGYEFVTVSELFRRRGVAMEDAVRYFECDPTGVDLGRVEAPVITYEAAEGGVRVTIDSPSGAPVYYSLDGSRLNQESAVYTESFVTSLPLNIRAAAAFNMNGGRSEEVTFTLDKLPCEPPIISLVDGVMQLSCETADVPIYYTLDGSEPGEGSLVYTEPVSVEKGSLIRAVAGGGEYMLSPGWILYYSPNGNLFLDVMPWQWFRVTIDALTTMGLMQGVAQYVFAPNATTTRAMMVTLLYRYSGEALEAGWTRTNTFTDVAEGAWYAEAVEWASSKGVVAGYPDNTFGPGNEITRQEMAQMIMNFLSYRGNALAPAEDCRGMFADGGEVGGWAVESVSSVVAAGLMQGDDQLRLLPRSGASRAEFATVLVRMMDLEEQMEQERAEQEQPTEPETEPSEAETESTEPETLPSEPEETQDPQPSGDAQ